MCIVALARGLNPRYPLVLAANRDEFFCRPTRAADFWDDAPDLLAGRDLVAGGTWLGVARSGKLAAVTYFRERPHHPEEGRPSRGLLAAEFLSGNLATADYLDKVSREKDRFLPFNLLCGTFGDLWCFSNRGGEPFRLAPGTHAVSNGPLDSSWPKVVAAREGIARIASGSPAPEELFSLLARTERFPDETLPDTGIGLERERLLSPIFIRGEQYGTRSSTVILLEADGTLLFAERSFSPDGTFHEVCHRMRISFPLSAFP